MAQNADKNNIGILGVNDDGADEFGILQSDVGPGGAGIGGAVDAITFGLLAGANDDDVGIGGRYGYVTDGGDVFRIENWFPYPPCIGGFPNAASGKTHVVRGGIAGNARHRGHAARAIRTK